AIPGEAKRPWQTGARLCAAPAPATGGAQPAQDGIHSADQGVVAAGGTRRAREAELGAQGVHGVVRGEAWILVTWFAHRLSRAARRRQAIRDPRLAINARSSAPARVTTRVCRPSCSRTRCRPA